MGSLQNPTRALSAGFGCACSEMAAADLAFAGDDELENPVLQTLVHERWSACWEPSD